MMLVELLGDSPAEIATVLVALLPMQNATRTSFVIALLLVMIATPVLYSFFYWRRTRRAG